MSILPKVLYPLSHRLPLMMAGILVAVVVSTVWIAATRLHRAVMGEEQQRLRAGAHRIATVVDPSIRRMQREGERLRSIPAVAELAAGSRSAGALEEAQAALDADLKRNTQTVAIAVWTGDRLVAAAGPLRYVVADTPQLITRDGLAATLASRIGPLRRAGDTVFFATVTPIMGRDSTYPPAGAVVAVRRLLPGNNASLFGELIGRGARVRLGNADASLWSDFTKPVPGPAAGDGSNGGLTYEDPERGAQIAGIAPIVGAPWVAMVAVDQSIAIEPVRRFVLEAGWIAALLILAGVGLGWGMVKRSLRPLAAVTDAAEGIAAGDLRRRVQVTSRDEAGRLANSFNTMAERVSASQSELQERATALEAANAVIGESESRYHALVDHTPDGILVHRNGQILFANPAAATLLGFADPARLVSHRVYEFLPPSVHATVRERNRLIESGVKVPPIEVALIREDMEQAVVECSGIPIMVDGAPAVQAILHDVTQRKQLEEQFQQSQKMEAVGRLAGGIAHDFNNLLTVIDSYSEFVMHDMEPDDPRREDVGEVRRAAASAAKLTHQLLAFSRKQGRVTRSLHVNEAIQGMIGMLSRLIGDNVRLTTQLRDNVPMIHADPNQLQQVLLNLVVNARDAMPQGGELRIETSAATITGGPGSSASGSIAPGTYAMLIVQDTGVGMTPEVRAQIFEPFFTTKQVGRGTGLGLSTVYGIVKQAEGHVWVESVPGQGTTFKLYFPAHDDSDDSVETSVGARLSRPVTGGSKVLLVEDDGSVRQAVRRTLARADFSVVEAANGAEALAALERDSDIDLVITDLMMPGMSGSDLVAVVTSRWPGLPMILMSGYADDAGHGPRIPESVAFVEKPITPAELLTVVQRLLKPQLR